MIKFWYWLHDWAWQHRLIGLHFKAWDHITSGPCGHERSVNQNADGTPVDPTYYYLWAYCLYHTGSTGRWGLFSSNPWRRK